VQARYNDANDSHFNVSVAPIAPSHHELVRDDTKPASFGMKRGSGTAIPPPLSAADERRAVVMGLAAVALWSTVATAFKLGLRNLAPLQLLLLGTLVSAVFFWLAASRRASYRLSPRQLAQAALFGLINPFAYYIVLFEAYNRLPAQIAQPLNYTWAIALAILAVPLLGQRLSRRAALGIVISYLGVAILLTQGRLDGLAESSWMGVALALSSTVLWALYWLLKTRSQAHPLGLMAWSFSFAAPLIGLACIWGPGLPPLTSRNLLFGIWVGLVEMGITFLLWQHALRLTGHAGRLGQLIFLSPFVSLVLIATVLGERIHGSSVLGLSVIVAGLLVTRQVRS
jgi:drug/metabolite transporter (DMT)-like permease